MVGVGALLAALLGAAAPAAAQSALPGFGALPPPVYQSTAPAAVPQPPPINLGTPMDINKGGPWVIGEVLFFSQGQLSNDYELRGKVRAQRGSLYTKSDIDSDVSSIKTIGRYAKVDAGLYDIPTAPVPLEYATIAQSTSEARLVYTVTPLAAAASTTTVRPLPPAPVSGVIFTPTAYRGTGRSNQPGLGLDFNALYVIGRLYGKNSFANSPHQVNYIDRVGVWLLSADGKMQIQSEGAIRPAIGVGAQGTFLFRDSPQPKVNDPNPTISVNPNQKSTRLLSAGYFVASKKFGPVRSSAGIMAGNLGDAVAQFSEFLTPDALRVFAGQPGQTVISRTMPFVNFLMMPKPQYPLGIEFVKFDGAALHPILIDLKAGYFLHMNFDIGYLRFDGGYDLLGLLQFRFNQFPR